MPNTDEEGYLLDPIAWDECVFVLTRSRHHGKRFEEVKKYRDFTVQALPPGAGADAAQARRPAKPRRYPDK